MTHETEWIIKDHALRRFAKRACGREIKTSQFSPTKLTRDGLRLWIDPEGNGILVKESTLGARSINIVITFYSKNMIDATRFSDMTSSTESVQDDDILNFIIGRGKWVTVDEIRKRFNISHKEVSSTISRLYHAGDIVKSKRRSKGKFRWKFQRQK